MYVDAGTLCPVTTHCTTHFTTRFTTHFTTHVYQHACIQGGNKWGLDQGLAVLQSMSEDGQDADVVTYTALLDTCIASLRGAGIGH